MVGRVMRTRSLAAEASVASRISEASAPASAAVLRNGTTDYAWFVFLHGFIGAPTTHYLRRDP